MARSLEPKDEHTPPSPQLILPLRRVVEIQPRNTEVRRRLANAFAALNRNVEAVQTLHELAKVFVDTKEPARSLETLEEVLHLDPFHVESRQLQGELTERRGDRDGAFRIFRDLGGLCLRAGLGSEASSFLRRALALRPEDPDTLWDCARAEELRGRMSEAATLYGRLVAIEGARENQGRSRAAQEKYTECSHRPSKPGTAKIEAPRAKPTLPTPPLPAG